MICPGWKLIWKKQGLQVGDNRVPIINRQAIIFGATGAIGSHLLDLCLNGDQYERVFVIARRAANLTHPKLDWIVCEYDSLDGLEPISGLAQGDAFCCLGTTIKSAGSDEQFRRVDFDFVVNAAQFANVCEIRNFSLISSIGANAKSRTLYTRTKGEVEAALIAENLPSLRIFRPSLLVGERDEFRISEEVSSAIGWLLTPIFHLGLRKYQPIKIETVARALLQTSTDDAINDSLRVFESDELQSY